MYNVLVFIFICYNFLSMNMNINDIFITFCEKLTEFSINVIERLSYMNDMVWY